MNERLDRLLSLRGDPVKGLAATAWAANLGEFDRDLLMRAVIAVCRKLLIPEWASHRPDDKRPQQALDAAEAWLAAKTPDNLAAAKAAAKECTAARNETFGHGHGVVDAARAVAWAAGAKDNSDLWDSLTAVEATLLERIALIAEYKRAPEQRKAIVETLRSVLVPVEAAPAPSLDEIVPYAASGNFVVGQRLSHAKFGTVLVTAAGDKWIDVQLEDQTTKRLVQKPKS